MKKLNFLKKEIIKLFAKSLLIVVLIGSSAILTAKFFNPIFHINPWELIFLQILVPSSIPILNTFIHYIGINQWKYQTFGGESDDEVLINKIKTWCNGIVSWASIFMLSLSPTTTHENHEIIELYWKDPIAIYKALEKNINKNL